MDAPCRAGRRKPLASFVRPPDPLAWHVRRGEYIFLVVMMALCASLALG